MLHDIVNLKIKLFLKNLSEDVEIEKRIIKSYEE